MRMSGDNQEVQTHSFERVIGGATLSMPVDCTLRFMSVSGVSGSVFTPMGILSNETASLEIEIKGDFMGEGFEHGVKMTDEGEFSRPYYQVLKKLDQIEAMLIKTYFEEKNEPPTRYMLFKQSGSTELASVRSYVTGKANGHSSWSGGSPS